MNWTHVNTKLLSVATSMGHIATFLLPHLLNLSLSILGSAVKLFSEASLNVQQTFKYIV
jgi:hypothetical protein